jgi:hypothetical protein
MVAENLLNLFFGLVELLLGLRVILKLFGANTGNDFVSWVYNMSDTLMQPFRGIFPVHVFENKYVLEFSAVFAMLMYAVLALVILAVINAADNRSTVVVKKR